MKRNDTIYLSILTVIILLWAMAWLRTVSARPCGDECAFIVKPSATATQVYIAPPATEEPSAYPAPATATVQGDSYPAPQPTVTEWTPDPEATHAPTATPPDPSKDYVPPTATAPRAYP